MEGQVIFHPDLDAFLQGDGMVGAPGVVKRLVADATNTYILSGNGDVIEPDETVAAIGSGGAYAKAAATALVENTKLNARDIAEKSMAIAGKICIYTNETVAYEELS